jgi:hypothetical protein
MAVVRILIVALLCIAIVEPTSDIAEAQAIPPKLILITLDGARIEEMFGGLDVTVLRSTMRQNQKVERQPVYHRFWAETAEQRREKLMPFFWGTLMREHGSIAGNVRIGSAVTLTNRHRFSYPGYAEILLGEAHDEVIASNDPARIPYVTLLEELKRSLRLPQSGVAVFTSWDVFSAIVEHEEGALTVNDGFRAFDHPDPQIRHLSELQFQTPTPWEAVRHDVYTFRFAMAHLKTARPQVMYLALGETDDWAHDGRYDRVLEAYARTDEQLRELWTWLQGDDEYRGRTHILMTTDHGRGRTGQDWRNHGDDVEGAQDVWIAFVSPDMPRRGEWREHPALRSNQIAATLAGWMGLDWSALRPAAGRAIR